MTGTCCVSCEAQRRRKWKTKSKSRKSRKAKHKKHFEEEKKEDDEDENEAQQQEEDEDEKANGHSCEDERKDFSTETSARARRGCLSSHRRSAAMCRGDFARNERNKMVRSDVGIMSRIQQDFDMDSTGNLSGSDRDLTRLRHGVRTKGAPPSCLSTSIGK